MEVGTISTQPFGWMRMVRLIFYWGNPHLYYAKLNEDMISFKGGIDAKAAVDEKREVGRIVMTEEGFGSPDVEKRDSTQNIKIATQRDLGS